MKYYSALEFVKVKKFIPVWELILSYSELLFVSGPEFGYIAFPDQVPLHGFFGR